MATAMQIQRTAAMGQAVRPAARATVRVGRVATVTRAAAEGAETRRAVLGGLVASFAALSGARANAVDLEGRKFDIIDDRKALEKGFELIYEARDLDLPQAEREGFTQARTELDTTKTRVKESAKRISQDVKSLIDKQYWTKAREELRGQVGTLRFDINALASSLDKPSYKKVLSLKEDLVKKIDTLDFAMRKKSLEKATPAFAAVTQALDTVVAAVV